MKLRYYLTLGFLFIAAGLMLGYGTVSQHLAARNVAILDEQVLAASINHAEGDPAGRPVRIVIPALKISVPIVNGYYDEKKGWTLTNDSAQFATITPEPNEKGGNTFIYGHNQTPIFGHLPKIKAGQEAMIFTDSGHRFTYTFVSARETSPYDNSLFLYEGAPILTLQTCSGIFSQNRELFTFVLKEAV